MGVEEKLQTTKGDLEGGERTTFEGTADQKKRGRDQLTGQGGEGGVVQCHSLGH
jgi:hypothetical protein